MDIETRFEIVQTINGNEFTHFVNSRDGAIYSVFGCSPHPCRVKVVRYLNGEPLAEDGISAEVLCGESSSPRLFYTVVLSENDHETREAFASLTTALRVADGWCRCE